MDTQQPNPPARRNEDFPKTTTIPDGWITDAFMYVYNRPSDQPAPDQGSARATQEQRIPSSPATEDGESLFARRLDPFPPACSGSGTWL